MTLGTMARTGDGTTHGTTADTGEAAGTTLGITEAHGVSMTPGTMVDGIHTTHIMQDGMAASAGILIITTIIITQAISQVVHQTRIISGARDTRQDLKDLLRAGEVLCVAEQA